MPDEELPVVRIATVRRALEEAGFVEEEPCVFLYRALQGEPWQLVLSPDPNGDVVIRHVLRAIAQQIPILEIEVRNWIARNFEMEGEEGPGE